MGYHAWDIRHGTLLRLLHHVLGITVHGIPNMHW